MSAQSTQLISRADGAFVDATLLDGLAPNDLGLVERAWGPARLAMLQRLLADGVPRSERPESLHWDWTKKAPELSLLEANGYGIVCDEEWQGVILTKTALEVARLEEDAGKPLVYIDYLEAAPWNWRVAQLGQEGRYKGVGSILCRQAVMQSLDEGFHGRVGLHALPRAESFYERVCGMTALGLDVEKHNLLYFEFSRQQARSFLQEGGAS